ncbi:Bro-N domain-containing protein [Pseudomonas sp. 1912-s]|uniref:BRO-N domain-containing protein n=1 Tax=Pseudomonas sp. 1912-s TaxID=3033802 RepID=UPI0023DFEAA7|nr:Bro-N domain-containing protein [Pseudomonas sp. 1912-s]MDF3198256.1 Bro-N domain-containing protein [Pseudomonas sp. 1912-s]
MKVLTPDPPCTPEVFTRHHQQLHAILIDAQAWFSARDIGHLMGLHLNEALLRKLDPDQQQTLTATTHRRAAPTLMLSESGVYAMLIYHYCPENRALRQWLTHEVVPALRDKQQASESPALSWLAWSTVSLSVLRWRNEPWIRLRDMPKVLPGV